MIINFLGTIFLGLSILSGLSLFCWWLFNKSKPLKRKIIILFIAVLAIMVVLSFYTYYDNYTTLPEFKEANLKHFNLAKDSFINHFGYFMQLRLWVGTNDSKGMPVIKKDEEITSGINECYLSQGYLLYLRKKDGAHFLDPGIFLYQQNLVNQEKSDYTNRQFSYADHNDREASVILYPDSTIEFKLHYHKGAFRIHAASLFYDPKNKINEVKQDKDYKLKVIKGDWKYVEQSFDNMDDN